MKQYELSADAKRVQNRIAEVFNDAEQKKAKYKAYIEDERTKLKEASDKLEQADDPNEYKSALDQIGKSKGAIDFFNKKMNDVKPGLSSEESKELLSIIKNDYAELLASNADKLNERIIDMLEAYAESKRQLHLLAEIIEQLYEIADMPAQAKIHCNDAKIISDLLGAGSSQEYRNTMQALQDSIFRREFLAGYNLPY